MTAERDRRSRFTLVVLPDGSAILTTPDDLTEREAQNVIQAFETWRETPKGVAILANCRVQHATSVVIDLPRASHPVGTGREVGK